MEELIEPGLDKEGKKISPIIKDYDDMSRDTTVDFTITFQKGKVEELETTMIDHGCNGLEKILKLTTTNTTTNMHLFDADDKLKKYENVQDIIDDYFVTRLELYSVRKEHMIDALEKELVVLSNKARYIQELLDNTIDLRKKKKIEIIAMLSEKGYNIIEGDDEYKYLIRMPMDSVSEENVDKLNREHKDKSDTLQRIKDTTIYQMWLSELQELEHEYTRYRDDRSQIVTPVKKAGSKIVVKQGSSTNKKIVKKATAVNLVEDA